MTAPVTLEEALTQCLQETLDELTVHVTRWEEHVHTDLLRKKAGKIDGIRFVGVLLRDRQLLKARKRAELVAALRLLGVATQAAACGGVDGFYDGVSACQVVVGKLIEAIDAANAGADTAAG